MLDIEKGNIIKPSLIAFVNNESPNDDTKSGFTGIIYVSDALYELVKKEEKVGNPKNDTSTLFNSNNRTEPYLKDEYIIEIKENFDMILGDIYFIYNFFCYRTVVCHNKNNATTTQTFSIFNRIDSFC